MVELRLSADKIMFRIEFTPPTLKGLNLCFNIMNVKLCLLNQEMDLSTHYLFYFLLKSYNNPSPNPHFNQLS